MPIADPEANVVEGHAPQDVQAPRQARPQRKHRRAYSVNFSHSTVSSRKKPCDLASREEFAVLLKLRHQEVFKAEAEKTGLPENTVLKVMVFKELHSDGNIHFFAAVLCDRPYGNQHVQKLLQTEDKIFTTFGVDHTSCWLSHSPAQQITN